MVKQISLESALQRDEFHTRHIGINGDTQAIMLAAVEAANLDDLIDRIVPPSIRMPGNLALANALTETEVIGALRAYADRNVVATSLIGQGYYGTVTPPVIQRNILENPAWYTAYTPYQPEISQGRLEALLNFQTVVIDLTGMTLANASMLDEGTSAAEAMTMCRRQSRIGSQAFFIDADTHPQTIAVIATRAEPIGIEIVVGNPATDLDATKVFGALFSYPGTSGVIRDHTSAIEALHSAGALAVVASDLLSLMLLRAPGEMGADMVVGSSQRFGVPMGFGGPHAAFLACRDSHSRALPGRLVGVSTDTQGRPALRLALQTREQHIRREKATSNICTAQVLLAVMAGMYAVWHGPDGLRQIANRVHALTSLLRAALVDGGITVVNDTWFDTLTISLPGRAAALIAVAESKNINFRSVDADTISVSLDETSTLELISTVSEIFGVPAADRPSAASGIQESLVRTNEVLTHPVFHSHRSEHDMLRYLRSLADKDLALDRTMIPLGSCTMKLNATTEMVAVTWPEFANIHPYAPPSQTVGYRELITDLERMLVACTGYDAVSLQPNAGSQGELAGLLAIRAYHRSRGDVGRDICLIPSSAHGTNAASAVMAGMRVVVVACDDDGNVDLADLATKVTQYGDLLAGCMVTYPSTHGVFETGITELCAIVHNAGGQVYVDGANLNALVGLAQPGKFGADVSHLNLHKTFCIPHGGGGPGVGPVAVRAHLAPFLPGDPLASNSPVTVGRAGSGAVGPVASAMFGSAGILVIPWAYIALMGANGLRAATSNAILSANYIARRLHHAYPVLYTGQHGDVAHECILDLRPITKASGVTADDVAKRLMDYGFHAPTLSFPVTGTLMVEPTESESLVEIDRFVDAMLAIRTEIDRVESGEWPHDNNPLHNAPHTAEDLLSDSWDRPYSREIGAFPVPSLRRSKYFAPVSRIDAAFGDRNLVCICPPVESLAINA